MDEQVGLGQLKRGATVRTKPEAEADGADLATVPYTYVTLLVIIIIICDYE